MSEVKELWILKDAIGATSDILLHEPTRHTVMDFVHVVPKSDYDKLNQECELLLADRSEKYRIAMDKGVDVLFQQVKDLQTLLGECEFILKTFVNNELSLRVVHDLSVDSMASYSYAIKISKEMRDKIKAARGGK